MTAFLEATKTAPRTLLLPAATEQEITRHIQEQVDAASKVLSDAKRREGECKIAFDARVSYSASVSFDDPDSLVSDSSEMSGVTKLKLDAAGENVLGVIRLEFDDDNVCVTGIPENGWSDDWEDNDRSEEEF